ncbi:MAG: hypothetical protein M0C28_43535 [Candidatus Moduliflexus flocculans]|nr:hypothetical protein [Candidatus Moduliflexus flocculans]
MPGGHLIRPPDPSLDGRDPLDPAEAEATLDSLSTRGERRPGPAEKPSGRTY